MRIIETQKLEIVQLRTDEGLFQVQLFRRPFEPTFVIHKWNDKEWVLAIDLDENMARTLINTCSKVINN
jgi:hypothetical protein